MIYVAGNGDASKSLRAFEQSTFNSLIGHAGYSDQLFRVCDELDVELLALCSHPEAQNVSFRGLRVERRPNPTENKRGIAYLRSHVAFARQLLADVRRFRADVVMVGSEPFGFLLEPLRLSGVKVIQDLHCVLWPEFRPRGKWRVISRFLRSSYRRTFVAVLSASHYITRQVESVAKRDVCPIVEFLPTFRREAYAVAPPDAERRPFRVMFVGRFEANKGVFTLLEVGRRLKKLGRTDIVFDLCGNGGAYEEIRQIVEQEGLGDILLLHGWCAAEKLREISNQSHLYVVPTTTTFIEGFNHVVVEGLLVGRPVITSKVCPAVDYVPDCVYLAEPDSTESYLNAIVTLADDLGLYKRLQARCLEEAGRFLTPEEGFGAAVRHVLLALKEGRSPERRTIALRADQAGAWPATSSW